MDKFRRAVLDQRVDNSSGRHARLEDLKWAAEMQFVLDTGLDGSPACDGDPAHSRPSGPSTPDRAEPWRRHDDMLDQRLARLRWMLAQGRRVADILLVHPAGVAPDASVPRDQAGGDTENSPATKIARFLLAIHRDFDCADEEMLRQHGRAVGGRLRLGDIDYAIVIIAPSGELQDATAALLGEFRDGGGQLIAIGDGTEPPERAVGPDIGDADGADDSRAEDRNDRESGNRAWLAGAAAVCRADDPDALEKALFRAGWPRVQVKDNDGEHAGSILVLHHDLDTKQLLFLLNADRDQGIRADIALTGVGGVCEWDLDSGDVRPIPARQAMGNTGFALDFAPGQSRLIVVDPEEEAWIGSPGKTSDVGIFYGEEEWELAFLDPNALPLDSARWRVNGGEWSAPSYLLDIRDALARRAGQDEVTLAFTFENRMTRDPGALHLVVQAPEEHRIVVNDRAVPPGNDGFWVHPHYRKVPISGLLVPGTNTIEISRRGPDVHVIHVIGTFGVSPASSGANADAAPAYIEFAITDPPTRVRTGDLSRQGLPFFCGTAALEQEIWIPERPGDDVRAILELEALNAIAARIVVNDREAGRLAWRPYRIDITDLVPEGENIRLRLELSGSAGNPRVTLYSDDGRSGDPGADHTHSDKGSSKGSSARADGHDAAKANSRSPIPFGIEGDVLVLFEVTDDMPTAGAGVRRQCR